MFQFFTALLWCALVGAAPARAMRLSKPVFTRDDCAHALLSPGAAVIRREIVRGLDWLAERPLLPVNFKEPRIRFEDIDPDFAEFKLGEDATVAELKAVRKAAADLRKQAYETDRDVPLSESTRFSDLQAAALGLGEVPAERSDAYTVHLRRPTPELLTLETRDGDRVLGAVDLDLANIGMGFEGDIEFWTYNRLTAGTGRVPPIGVNHFLSEVGVAVLRPVGGANFAFVLRWGDLDANHPDASVQLDVHRVRECAPEVAAGGRVHVVPYARADGRAWCFTPTGLKLLTFEVSNP